MAKLALHTLVFLFLIPTIPCFALDHSESVSPIWYAQPASDWNEALPIGNGRLAAMVFGNPNDERIQFNEESLWSGRTQDSDNPLALQMLPEIQKHLLQGNIAIGQKWTQEFFVCQGPGTCRGKSANGDFGCYQTFGDIFLSFPLLEGEVKDYRRELDLNQAIVRVTFSINDVKHFREYFISAEDQVCIIHLGCDKPGSINFDAKLQRQENASTKSEGQNSLLMQGQLGPGEGLKFTSKLVALPVNGEVESNDNILTIRNADSVILLIAAQTNFKEFDFENLVIKQIDEASKIPFKELKDNHISEYQSYFNRVSLFINGPNYDQFPTDARLRAVKDGFTDTQLITQYFHYGRYLLISSSRPGCLPANLQGKWAHLIQTPWNCDYHTNINLQMNYWPAEVCNLSDCHAPLFKFISTLQEPGRKTAKTHYGAKGWVVNHATNLWGFTSPAEQVKWGLFPSAGGWLCQHLWEHYLYNDDLDFLKDSYPIMKESSQFYLDTMIEESKHGWLVTCPSSSPENTYFGSDGNIYSICIGPSMDSQIIWNLFSNTIEAGKILNDHEFVKTLEVCKSKLPPAQIGKYGQLQEWLEDYDEPEPGHRHISHLFALHPGYQITLEKNPELANAAKISLERRLEHGGGHTGWSQAWIINFWARLKEGERCLDHLYDLLNNSTLPNLLDSHPHFPPHTKPLFQIDGNFGATAGIAEMLLQSHDEEINLLPAVPSSWSKGHFKGLKARGNVEIDLEWSDGKILAATLKAKKSGIFKIRYPSENLIKSIEPISEYKSNSENILELKLESGKVYSIQFKTT